MAFKQLGISKVFLRFFLSFLLVLIIPLFILGAISRQTIKNIMHENESARQQAALSQCAEDIGSELANLSTIIFKASVEQEFSPYMMENFIQNSLSTMKSLKSYKTANSFIHEIYLFSPYSDYIYSTGTTYSYERFITQKLPNKLLPADLSAFLSQTAAETRYGYTQTTNDDNFFLVYPLPSYTLMHYAYMIFEIPKAALLLHFNTTADSAVNSLMVFDNDRCLASFVECSEERQQQILREIAVRLPSEETGFLKAADNQEPLFYLVDKKSGITYVLSLPVTDTMAAVDQVVNLFTFHLILTALLGTLAIYILARLNYLPIKKLAKSTNGLLGGGIPNKGVDEIDYLYGFVQNSQSSYQKMNLELQDSLPATKYFFIKNLINAHPYTPNELQDMLERTSMHFYAANFFVVIIHIHSKGRPAVTANIANFLSVFRTKDVTGYAANLYKENIVGIYSCVHADTEIIREQFSLLHQKINRTYHVMLTLGIGSLKPDLSCVAASFLEATAALDCRFIMGKNQLIFFYDLKLDSFAEIDYSQGQIDKICLYIKAGEKKLLFQTLKMLFSSIKSSAYSMYIAKSLCYDVTNNIIKALKEMEENNIGFQVPDLIALTAFETVEELELMLCQYCETACEFVNSLRPLSLSNLAINLIIKNYTQPDFSISSISETLGVSTSYLSHTFKEQQSITLNDYIKKLKIGLAKKMLAETDDSLNKIIHLLGYYDCSSFIRMFKKSEGITPGEFRKPPLLK